MFDFDSSNEKLLNTFCDDIKSFDNSLTPEVHKTPHGYAVIVQHGFDTRELIEKYNKNETIVTLKRDDMLCVDWRVNA